MVKQRMVCRSLFVGALLIGGAGCNGVVPSDQPDGVETILSPVVYDNGQRPVPRSFLSLRTSGTKCCVGSAATGCSQLCSDSNGLVTQAGMDKTAEYYSATYQYGLTTLDKFKDYYNIPQRRPGELLRDYRQRAGIVVYYNASELGLGRELGCGETASGANYRVGCYVSNFGDSFASMDDPNSNTNREFNSNGTHTGLYNATMGIQPKGTVCISYDVTRPADHKVQFAAYDARGDRTDKAQLDTMGARPVPEICTNCHGGSWDGDQWDSGGYNVGMVKKARFLPLITSLVVFPLPSENPQAAGYELAQQEDAIRRVNQIAWHVRNDALTPRQQQTVSKIYKATPSYVNCSAFTGATCPTTGGFCLKFASSCIPAGAKTTDTVGFIAGNTIQRPDLLGVGYAANTAVSGTNINQDQLYRNVVLRYCDTCHMAFDGTDGFSNLGYNAFASWQALGAQASTLKSVTGISGTGSSTSWATTQSSYVMPHSQNLNERFWTDAGGVDSKGVPFCRIANVGKPAADCMLLALGASRPTTAVPTTAQAQSPFDCGQATGDTHGTPTTGYNSGRYNLKGVCRSGCQKGSVPVWCPGSEQNLGVALGEHQFTGTRQECAVIPKTPSMGICKSCGRLHQPICRNVGPNCDTAFDPYCNALPACHEGFVQGPAGSETCEDSYILFTSATQSSDWDDVATADKAIDGDLNPDINQGHASSTYVETAPWWLGFWIGQPKYVTQLEIYNGVDLAGFQNIVVEYSDIDAGGVVKTVPGADMRKSGTGATGSVLTVFTLPAPIHTDSIKISSITGPVIELAEVQVRGY